MFEPLNLRNLAWAITVLLEVVLFFYLLRKRLYRSHPAFFVYVLSTILQNACVMFAHRHWGSQSIQSWNIGWGSQAVVLCARWFAVAEIARKIFSRYSGIWKLASGILFAVGLGVLGYSIAWHGVRLQGIVLSADRAVEFSLGSFIVGTFLFAHYYRLTIANLERRLAIGFCLYSASWVISDSFYEYWRSSFGGLWNFLEILAFLASLLLWITAVRSATEPCEEEVQLVVPPEVYEQLSQELNSRLQLLDNRLNNLLRSGDSRS